MGLYTVLKPCLKGENTNVTKNDLKCYFRIFHLRFLTFWKKLIFLEKGELWVIGNEIILFKFLCILLLLIHMYIIFIYFYCYFSNRYYFLEQVTFNVFNLKLKMSENVVKFSEIVQPKKYHYKSDLSLLLLSWR